MKHTHFATAPEPFHFGENITAICGQVVPAAQPAAWWDNDVAELGFAHSVGCQKCNRAEWEELRYVAVIQSGEESIER